MNARENAARETSAGHESLEQPSPPHPTTETTITEPTTTELAPDDADDALCVTPNYGYLRTRCSDGLRVYVTSNHEVASHFLGWGWPLHPGYSEYWCRQTGTYLFHVPTDWHILRAEPIAALPSTAYTRWKQAVLQGWAASAAAVHHLSKTERQQQRMAQRTRVQQAQRRVDRRYPYRHERWARGPKGIWVPDTPIETWDLCWPKGVQPGSIPMSDPQFGDYVPSGGCCAYDHTGRPRKPEYWYVPFPPPMRGRPNDYSGTETSEAAEGAATVPTTDGLALLSALWYDLDHDTDTLDAVEGAVDAEPVFPALVQTYLVGDGKREPKKRVGQVERMLRWLQVVYGPQAAVAAEAYLMRHCPEYLAASQSRAQRLSQRGRKAA